MLNYSDKSGIMLLFLDSLAFFTKSSCKFTINLVSSKNAELFMNFYRLIIYINNDIFLLKRGMSDPWLDF